MDSNDPQLKDGSDYQLYNRHIVDEAGLNNLIEACQIAIEKGEYVGQGLDDFIAVSKLDSTFLKDNQESKSTPIVLMLASVLFFFIMFLVVLGFIDFIGWF